MKTIELKKINHNYTVGSEVPDIEPNIFEDSLFLEEGKVIGFFIKKIPDGISNFVNIANKELRSDRVPKSVMKRSSGLVGENEVLQYSTIIGAVPPKPNMRRDYPTMSSVHNHKSASIFIKAMLKACYEAEEIIKSVDVELFNRQIDIIKNTPEKWRFGRLFTSSISNYNISANCHIDRANLKNTVNVIITKRNSSSGGNLFVPDYGACINQEDNSMLVYPAWKSLHGVTPIIQRNKDGYRNSLVFYPLKAFEKCI